MIRIRRLPSAINRIALALPYLFFILTFAPSLANATRYTENYTKFYNSLQSARNACEADRLDNEAPFGVDGSCDHGSGPQPVTLNSPTIIEKCPAGSGPLNWFYRWRDNAFQGGGTGNFIFCGGGDPIVCPSGTWSDVLQQCVAGGGGGGKGLGCPDKPVGHPCNPATGNKYLAQTDIVGGNEFPGLTRHYNSQFKGDVGFGYGWMANVRKRLQFVDGKVLVRSATGRGEIFTCNNTGVCTGDSDTNLLLRQEIPGTEYYYLTYPDGSFDEYYGYGILRREIDRNGRTTQHSTFSSRETNAITAPSFHRLTFSYIDASGHVAFVTDAANKVYGYLYDTNGNLVRVNYPDSTAKLYHYENTSFPNHLTGVSHVEANGATTRYANYTYDASGKAISTELAGGMERFTLQYDSDTQTTVTDAANTQQVMTFSTTLGMTNLLSNVNQGDGKSVNQTFNANNNLTCKKDEEGKVATYTYNGTNQKTSMTEGLVGNCASPITTSATRTTTYQHLSSVLDLPTQIQMPSVSAGQSKTVTMIYGDTRFPTLPTNITQNGFTPSSAPVSRAVGLTYNSTGQVNSINGPRLDVSDITTLLYNECTTGGACGQLNRITNALGHITTYDSYDGNGRLLQMTDPNALRTNYVYDGRGRVTSITQTPPAGSARVTQYSYNAANNITQAIQPDGIVLSYLYDAAQKLRQVTDNLGNRVNYNYDLKGNRTEELTSDPDGTLVRSLQTAYDIRNRVASLNQGGSVTQWLNDAIGNLTRVTDSNQTAAASGVSTNHTHDALNRLIETVNNLSGVTSYNYDIGDRLTRVQAPNNAATQYQYDDLGDLLQETSPDRGTTVYSYDAAGNVVQMTDARGVVVGYTYDPLNRVTLINYPGTSEDVTFAYDTGCIAGIGRLCTMQDESGATSYAYDVFGNRLQQAHTELGITYTTSYTYDNANRVLAIAYPKGRLVTHGRDAIGRISATNATVNGASTAIIANRAYQADGLLRTQTFGNGLTETRAHDLQGRLIAQTVPRITPPTPPVSSVVLAPNVPSPQFPGTAITFTAQASGGTGSYQYRFTLTGPGTGNVPSVVQNYAAANTFVWNTAATDIGTTTITVDARNAGLVPGSPASASTLFTINAPPPSNAPVIINFGTITAAQGSERRFTVEVPAGAANLTVTLRGGSGDADLYVKYGAPPSDTNYDCFSVQGGADGQSETCVVVATPGTWHILVIAYSNIANVAIEARYTTIEGNRLSNGVPLPGHTAPTGSQWLYAIDVPANAANLKVTLTGGTGDADLYVKYASAPTLTTNDCYAINGGIDGHTETCVLTATEGRWYILINAYEDISNVTLTASYTTGDANVLQNGVPLSGLTGAQDSQLRYAIDVPSGAANLTFTLSGGTGDADLYVKYATPPTDSTYDCASIEGGADGLTELCTPPATPGRWHILVRAYNDITNVTLTASYTTGSARASDSEPTLSARTTPESQLIAIRNDTEGDYHYWVKNEATQHQWLAVNADSPYLMTTPERLARIEMGNVELWQRNAASPLGYDYLGSTEESGTIRPVALSTNPSPAPTETKNYAYDPNGNLLGTQLPSVTDLYGYDVLDRLTLDRFGSLPPVQFGYDQNGNRTNQLFDGFSESSSYSLNSNRLTQKGAQTLTYDPSGNITNDGQGRTYAYNQAGRLSQAFNNSTLVATYTYNAQGQRTRKVTQQGTTLYHYDEMGNLITETSQAGQLRRDYVYADSIPIAQIDAAGTEDITYLHTDHLGTPRSATDANRTVIWSWRSFGFGNSEPNNDPDGDGVNTVVNLRYPGQYADSESGLYYNWNRYYDPRIGRYITSDPIGLGGGFNTYAYVENNPLRWSDPDGLFVRIGPIEPLIDTIIRVGPKAPGPEPITPITPDPGAQPSPRPAPSPAPDSSGKDNDRNNYKRICDQPPPPGLSGCDLLRWKLNKARQCKVARDNFALKYYGGLYDPGHAIQMDQLDNQIRNLEKAIQCCRD